MVLPLRFHIGADQMAGKSLQRDKKIKDNQSTITHFFSKKTATHDQNSPKQQTDPTEQEIQIKSSYFSPEKKIKILQTIH